jgi:hypothetical protein
VLLRLIPNIYKRDTGARRVRLDRSRCLRRLIVIRGQCDLGQAGRQLVAAVGPRRVAALVIPFLREQLSQQPASTNKPDDG